MFGIIEYGLYQRLKGGIACFQVVDILFVYTFPAVIRIRIIDAIGAVDGGAGSAAWGVAIALGGHRVRRSIQRLQLYRCGCKERIAW